MNINDTIIELYPQIINLQYSNFTIKEICDILSQRNIFINYNTLLTVLNKIKHKTLYPKYNKLAIIQPQYYKDPLVENISINFNGLLIAFNSPKIKHELLLNESNLMNNFMTPLGIIYAKHFLQLYHLDNQLLLKNVQNKWRINLNKNDSLIIQNIHSNIKNDYAKILSELKAKALESILI